MQKLLLLILSAFFSIGLNSCSSSDSEPPDTGTDAPQTTVYICDGPYAEAYHNTPDCTGLSNCSGSVLEVTEQEAIDMGRHPCEICY